MSNRFCSFAVVLSLMLATPALAVIRFFPSPPGDDLGTNTVDYNLGSFSLVVVGFQPDPTSPDSKPFPFTNAFETTLNVVDGGIFNSDTYVYTGSILNISGGTLKDIYLSYDPTTGGALASSDATVNISGGTVGSVLGYHHDTIKMSGGTASTVSVDGAGSIFMTGGQAVTVSATQGSTAYLSSGIVTNDVTAGTSNEAVTDHTGIVEINGASVGGSITAEGSGHLILTAGAVSGSASAMDNSSLDLNAGALNGDVSASGGGIVTLGSTMIGGQASLSDHASLIGGASGGTIAKGINTSDQAQVSLTAEKINGPLNLGGASNTFLTGCSVTVSSGAAVTTLSSSVLTLGGASTVTGDVYALDTSSITLQGSVITGNVYASGGTINMAGGIIVGHVTLLGGTFNYSGGIVTQNVGGMIAAESLTASALTADSLGFSVEDGGTLNIYGTDFTYQLIDANYLGQYSEYALTGYLADGTYVSDSTFLVQNNSASTFALLPPVPEPAGIALAMPALLLFRRRRLIEHLHFRVVGKAI